LIKSFLSFTTKALSLVVKIKDINALQNELKNDYIITKEMSALSGGLALRCGRLLAVALMKIILLVIKMGIRLLGLMKYQMLSNLQ